MVELNSICRDVTISNNNTKADLMRDTLAKYDVPFRELGPGTNRYAVRIDGYVFKIAMDKNGIDDNRIEFSMSDELQPFVTKTYECNDLIVVSEYVTVISKTEFNDNADVIKGILGHLAESYIFGDVGYTLKNFVNWGFRENGDLVILDYGYIYKVLGEEVRCTNLLGDDVICGHFLEYDEKFNNLICPKCRRKYSYDDIRRRIDLKFEKEQVTKAIESAYKLTSKSVEFDDTTKVQVVDDMDDDENIRKEETHMNTYEYTQEERDAIFDNEVEHAAEIIEHSTHTYTECDTSDEYDEYDEEYDDTDEDETPVCELLDEEFDVIELFGIKMLFTNARINDDDNIPDTLNWYHLRETDDFEYFGELKKNVFVNHGGSIITNVSFDDVEPLIIAPSDYSFIDEGMTLRQFMESVDGLHMDMTDDTIFEWRHSEGAFDDGDDEWMEDPEDVDIEDDEDDTSDEYDIRVDIADEPDTIVEFRVASCEEDTDEEPTTITEAIEEIVEDETIDEDEPLCNPPSEEVAESTEELYDELEERIVDTSDPIEAEDVEALVEDSTAFVEDEDALSVTVVDKDADAPSIDDVQAIWTDPDDSAASMRAELARLAEEEEEEESNRRRNKHYKNNKRNNY